MSNWSHSPAHSPSLHSHHSSSAIPTVICPLCRSPDSQWRQGKSPTGLRMHLYLQFYSLGALCFLVHFPRKPIPMPCLFPFLRFIFFYSKCHLLRWFSFFEHLLRDFQALYLPLTHGGIWHQLSLYLKCYFPDLAELVPFLS